MPSRFLAVAAVTLLTANSAFAQPAQLNAPPVHPMPGDQMQGDKIPGDQMQGGQMRGGAMPNGPAASHRDQKMPMGGHSATGMMGGMMGNGMGSMMAGGAIPTLAGQDAFAAVQEVVRILQADPHTDWSKVDLDRLREHLIDMNEVTLRAAASVQPIDGGIQVAVTGEGRTLDAIQRMVPDHATEINGQNGWQARTEALPNGVTLIVTSSDPKQVATIRGLGFIGVMASGTHHQLHHLMMAKGAFPH